MSNVHVHHIIPTYRTGGRANNHPDNLVELTQEEHAEAHISAAFKRKRKTHE